MLALFLSVFTDIYIGLMDNLLIINQIDVLIETPYTIHSIDYY
jgi:hypothetical protein